MAKETTSPRQRYRLELRRTILDAAREAFVQDGYEAVSMRSLASAVGLTHGAIYGYFKDKQEIFDSLVEESFDQLAAALADMRKRGTRLDPIRLLKRLGRAYVEFGLQNPSAYEFAFILRRPGRTGPDKPHRAYEHLRLMIVRCIEEGRLNTRNAELASQALWTAVHGVTSLLILRPAFPWTKKKALIARVVDAAVDGLVASPV